VPRHSNGTVMIEYSNIALFVSALLERVGMGGWCCLQLASCSDVVLVSGVTITYIVLRDNVD